MLSGVPALDGVVAVVALEADAEFNGEADVVVEEVVVAFGSHGSKVSRVSRG